VEEKTKPIIYIVDDDESVLRAMKRLILSMDMEVQTFGSAEEFLNSNYQEQNACLIADVKIPGVGGMELQQKLVAKASKLPVIFITAFDTEEIRSEARKAGAAGYFQKPVDDRALLDSIRWVLSRHSL
jgi:FixJ family two-component response regulator